jgi:hypothetical protein
MKAKLLRIAELVKSDPRMKFTSIGDLLIYQELRGIYMTTDKRIATFCEW